MMFYYQPFCSSWMNAGLYEFYASNMTVILCEFKYLSVSSELDNTQHENAAYSLVMKFPCLFWNSFPMWFKDRSFSLLWLGVYLLIVSRQSKVRSTQQAPRSTDTSVLDQWLTKLTWTISHNISSRAFLYLNAFLSIILKTGPLTLCETN